MAITREELRRFPVLRSAGGWSKDDAIEYAHSYFVAKASVITKTLLVQATDAASMGKLLRRAIRNYLIDLARKTPLGKIRRKVEDLLRSEGDFDQVPAGQDGAGRWRVAGREGDPFSGDPAMLVRAAYAVPGVRAVRWSGSREAPLASDRALLDILRAIFRTAEGSLAIDQILDVFVQRFPGSAEPADATLSGELFDRVSAPLEDRPDVAYEVSQEAGAVYNQMSPSQRALLPNLNKSVQDHQEILGVGRSQAYQAARDLRALFQELIADPELRTDIALEVIRLCQVQP